MTQDWCSEFALGIRLAIQVVPNAKRDEVVGPLADSLKIRLQAPAVEGKANAALVRYLAQRLAVSRSVVQVAHGLTARRKLIEVRSTLLTVADVKALLWSE